MERSAESLLDCCINYISNNLQQLCTVKEEAEGGGRLYSRINYISNNLLQLFTAKQEAKGLCFINKGIFLDEVIADKLLTALSDKDKLSDETIQLFQPSICRLKRVKIRQCQSEGSRGRFTKAGVATLCQHNLNQIEAVGFTSVSILDFVENFNKSPLAEITKLNFSRTKFDKNQRFPDQEIMEMKNLKICFLDFTALTNYGLGVIMSAVTGLEVLDISGTEVTDISSLSEQESTLQCLSLYDIPISEEIHKFHGLKHLDISVRLTHSLHDMEGDDILEAVNTLPNLTSLDVSGRAMLLCREEMKNFLVQHSQLKFIGLLNTECSDLPMLTKEEDVNFRSDLKVAGIDTVEQTLEILKRYPQRPVYLEEGLFHLYGITSQTDIFLECQYIIQLIVGHMKANPRDKRRQYRGTGCIYNILKSKNENIHPSLVNEVIELTLDARKQLKNWPPLEERTIVIIHAVVETIPERQTLQLRCINEALGYIGTHSNESVFEKALHIIYFLLLKKLHVFKITRRNARDIDLYPEHMVKLLNIVEARTHSKSPDTIMENTFEVICSLKDIKPEICEMLVAHNGVNIFHKAIQVLKPTDDTKWFHTILMIVQNVAEVKKLRKVLMTEEFLVLLCKLLGSSSIQASYSAAGIIAWLLSDKHLKWKHFNEHHDMLVDKMSTVISKWNISSLCMHFTTFRPLLELLHTCRVHVVHKWVIWTLQCVCFADVDMTTPDFSHCTMLVEEGGCEILEEILENPKSDEFLKTMCQTILDLCAKHYRYKRKTLNHCFMQ